MSNLDEQTWSFLQDDQFIKWVLSPDEDTVAYWENWMLENPEKVPALYESWEIVYDLAFTEKPEEVEQFSAEIWSGIQDKLDGVRHKVPVIPLAAGQEQRKSKRIRPAAWYWLAASLLGLVLLGAGVYYRSAFNNTNRAENRPAGSGARPDAGGLLADKGLERSNPTGENQVVYLVDGSRVILEPGASIRYATFFQKDRREVHLEGNAFFEVARDAARPFYVDTKELMVRVLGTSFTMATNKNNGDVSVIVRTGKVSVSKKTNPSLIQGQAPQVQEQTSLILVPNQKALYKAQTRSLVQSVPDKKDLTADLAAGTLAIPFNYEETPVIEIFKSMEKAYGIPLYYDDKMFSACVITTTLENGTFEERLKIICEAIDATYRIDDKGVFIESKDGKPCR